ncbi:MAG: hypothetical protein GEV07_30460 [Streptosporangiales bacterium]|nr:hypothetical protein [Streptosporangiales bacterium]
MNHDASSDHAAEALRLIQVVDRGVGDPHAVPAAQVHATLAVAVELRDVADQVRNLASKTGGP